MKAFVSKVWACLLTALATVATTACTDSMAGDRKDTAKAPRTTIVALDLSDRIADGQQAEQDIAAVTQAFQTFARNVRDDRYIRSNDRFLVTVIPQASTDKEVERMAATLSIDMAAIPMRQKLERFKELAAKLPGTIRDIYRKARKPAAADYSGANVFKFLNETLPRHVREGHGDVSLVILTDGYIELDNPREAFSRAGKTNHMNRGVMAGLREGDRWRTEQCDFLMIPERLCGKGNDLSRMSVTIVGLSPKNPYPFETSMVEKIWDSFLDRMKVGRHQIIPYAGNNTQVTCRAITEALT